MFSPDETATGRDATERDHGLDLLKGLGCICMVIGHAVFNPSDTVMTALLFTVGLGTVLFFGVAGVTTQFQMSRYSLRDLLSCYALFFLLGYSYSALVHPDLYGFFTLEIFQIIALGVASVGLIHWAAGPAPGVYAAVALLLLALNGWCQWRFPEFHGAGLLLPHASYVAPDQLIEPKVFPGFPLLCWLYTFPGACALYAVSRRFNLAVALLALSVLVALEAGGIDTRWSDKWSMSPGYACLEIMTLALALALAKSLRGWRPGPRNVLIYFGRNSLRFLYLHGLGIAAAYGMRWAGPYMAWTIGVVVTYYVMRGFERLPPWRRFESIRVWYVLIGACLALPLLMRLGKPWAVVVVPGEFVIGLLFARHFERLKALVKRRPGEGLEAAVPLPR